MGAEITYLEKEGCPPLKIVGKKLYKNEVSISAEVSSQFISSLLLVAGFLENGLKIALVGHITSRPYLEMTLKMLSDLGIETEFKGQTIEVKPLKRTCNRQQGIYGRKRLEFGVLFLFIGGYWEEAGGFRKF